MKEIGEVVKVDKNFTAVKISRRSECDKCGMCGMKKHMPFVEVKAANTAGAKVGDTVEIETGGKIKVVSVLLVFLVPLILLAAAIVIGYTYIKNELFILLLCLGTLIAWYTILAVIDRKFAKLKGFCPEITKILKGDTNE